MGLADDLRAFADYCRATRSAATARTYGTLVRRVLDRLPDGSDWTDLRPADLTTALLSAYGECSRATLNTAVSALRAFITWAHEQGRLPNPDAVHRLRRVRQERRLPKFLSDAEEKAVVEWILAHPSRMRTAYLLMLRGGLRRAEVRTFRPTRWEGDILWGRVTGKGSVERVVAVIPASDAERRLLRKYANSDGDRPPFPYSPAALTVELYRAMRNRGLHVTPHRLRHTYATRLLEQGVPLDVIQRLLGHASVATTQIYAITTADRIRTALRTVRREGRKGEGDG